MSPDNNDASSEAMVKCRGRITRHRLFDRMLHWISAVCVLVLLGTSFLPIIGIKFEWVTIHWCAGLVLLFTLTTHIWRVIQRKQFLAMWFGLEDIKLMLTMLGADPAKPGKYSPAQKLMHQGVTAMVLLTLLTGLVMMVKIDTPFWERNIYLFDDTTWGAIYVLHGIAALSLITTVMLHIYFALRPEKLLYTRSMIRGWLTKDEFNEHHDANKWQVK